MRLLSEDKENSSEMIERELALSKSVDGIADNMEKNFINSQSNEKCLEYEHEWREKCLSSKEKLNFDEFDKQTEGTDDNAVVVKRPDGGAWIETIEQPIEEEKMLSYRRKVVVLYELLSACLADLSVDDKKKSRKRKGYDARHRVALRLLSTWVDIKWIKLVCTLNFCYLFVIITEITLLSTLLKTHFSQFPCIPASNFHKDTTALIASFSNSSFL